MTTTPRARTARPATARAPQDRKAKTSQSPDLFWFTGADGKSYDLPSGMAAHELVSGRMLRDAMFDEQAETRLGIFMLEHCGAAQASLDALYDLPGPKFMTLVGQWLTWSRPGEASPGE